MNTNCNPPQIANGNDFDFHYRPKYTDTSGNVVDMNVSDIENMKVSLKREYGGEYVLDSTNYHIEDNILVIEVRQKLKLENGVYSVVVKGVYLGLAIYRDPVGVRIVESINKESSGSCGCGLTIQKLDIVDNLGVIKVINSGGGTDAVWGSIKGNIDNQTDLIEKFKKIEESIPTNTVTSEQLKAVEDKIPTDYVTPEELNVVKESIPTDTVTTEQLQEVKDLIPEDTVTSEQLQAVEDKIPTNYASKEELEQVQQSIPSIEGLATETFVKNGYTTKEEASEIRELIPSLDGLATEVYVQNYVSSVVGDISTALTGIQSLVDELNS